MNNEKYSYFLVQYIAASLQSNTVSKYGRVEVYFKIDSLIAMWMPDDYSGSPNYVDVLILPSRTMTCFFGKVTYYKSVSESALFPVNNAIGNTKTYAHHKTVCSRFFQIWSIVIPVVIILVVVIVIITFSVELFPLGSAWVI